jgi:hypothetical protein
VANLANYWQEMTESGRNWIEDFTHENGQYICGCVKCGKDFQGHKRRALCKSCASFTSETFSKQGD